MQVLMLNYEFPPLGGGAANANYYLLKEFAKNKKLKIDLITSSEKNIDEIQKFSDNITIHKLNVGKKDFHYWKMKEIIIWTWRAYWKTKELVKQKNYDLTHCWFGWPSGIIGYLFKKKIPYLIALRGSDVPGYNERLVFLDKIIFSPISKVVWKSAFVVVANSLDLKQLALKTMQRKIEIIYNGVDLNDFPGKKNYLGKRILCVSRLLERKGIKYLIEAMVDVNAELVIVGSGKQEDELKNMVKTFGVNKKIVFVGVVPHEKIKKYYNSSDLFVLPSLNEGMSNTVLEAMASALPIIITDTGGAKELVNGNGIVIPQKNPKAISKAINNYLNNPKLLEKHGKASGKIAETLSWGKVAIQYLDLYNATSKRY